MAYGIGSVIGDIDQKVDTYRNNPEALAQMYQQNQQLIDLLALQKLKTEKEAAMRDMQMKMQTPAASIKDQREQEVMGMMRNEVAQQMGPGLQAAGQQAAQAAAPQGGGLQSLPAPNMQSMGMAEGGIVAFADGGKTGGQDVDNPVVGSNPDGTPITRADYERMIAALEKGEDTAEDVERRALYEALGKTPSQAATPEISAADTEVNVMGQTQDDIAALTAMTSGAQTTPQPTPPTTTPTTTPDATAGIRAALPQNAGVELTEEGLKAVLNIPSEAVKQAPPEVQNEYTRRLSELRGEQESKLEALIAFMRGAGGKTSFAATMSGGAAGMNAREQQIENEIMATVDKIEGLKLKQQEIGISEEKNRIDREQLGISRASQATQQEYYQALGEAARRVTPQPTTDQEHLANTYVQAKRLPPHNDTRPDAVIRQEHYEIEANRAAAAAADRLGITSEQQRQKLYLDVMETATNMVNGNWRDNASKTAEERKELIQATIEQLYKNMQSLGGPAPTQQNSGLTPEDQALIDRYNPPTPTQK